MNPEEKEKKPKKVYSQSDLIQFENKNRYSSIGKQILSTHSTSGIFGFGTSKKEQEKKRFMGKNIINAEQKGTMSPGPAYDVREQADYYQYSSNPLATFGKKSRGILENTPRYDFYLRQDDQIHPDQACLSIKQKDATAVIGMEERFPIFSRFKGTPGAQYKQDEIFKYRNSPKFTFGTRKMNGFTQSVQTPSIVGPGTYIQTSELPKTSLITESPSYSIGKSPKLPNDSHAYDKYQTYDTSTKAIGKQISSRIKSQPNFSIGKSSKDAKLGIFQSQMVGNAPKIRIQLPQF